MESQPQEEIEVPAAAADMTDHPVSEPDAAEAEAAESTAVDAVEETVAADRGDQDDAIADDKPNDAYAEDGEGEADDNHDDDAHSDTDSVDESSGDGHAVNAEDIGTEDIDAEAQALAQQEIVEMVLDAGGEMVPLTTVLESLLFVSEMPVEPAQLAQAIHVAPDVAERGLYYLRQHYEETGRGLRLQERDGKFLMVTMPTASGIIEEFLNLELSTRLCSPALEALAIIAYRQPVTRIQIEAVRGVDCGGVLRTLLQRELIAEVGRLDAVGRPILYAATDLFMQHFGLTSINELPPLENEDADLLMAASMLAELDGATTEDGGAEDEVAEDEVAEDSRSDDSVDENAGEADAEDIATANGHEAENLTETDAMNEDSNVPDDAVTEVDSANDAPASVAERTEAAVDILQTG